MNLLKSLRVRAGKSMLAGRMSKAVRKQYYFDFYHAKTIGVVWDASRTEDFSILSKFHHQMAELNKEVKIFGYYPGKELPNQFTAIRYFRCIKTKDVDFFYRPLNQESQDFINTTFDILIDLNFKRQFPLIYVSSLSRASLKVGLTDSSPETSPFDIMISLKGPVNTESFLNQVIYYLEMINSTSEKKAV